MIKDIETWIGSIVIEVKSKFETYADLLNMSISVIGWIETYDEAKQHKRWEL